MIKSSLSRVAFATSSILGLFVATAMPATACDQWLAPARMEVIQGNGPRIGFSVIQDGTNIHGFAKYYTTNHTTTRTIIGNYSGTIVGDAFYARVLWTYSGVSAIGVYRGTIKPLYGVSDPKGYIFEGTTYDEYNNASDLVGWNAYHFTCQPVASPAPAPRPPPDFKENIDKGKHDAINAAFETGATESASDARATAAAVQPAPTVALGRVPSTTPSDPSLTICDHARSARARNSPAAPGLERQCTASGGSFAVLPPADPEPAAPPPAEPVPAPPPPVDPTQLDALAAKGAQIAQADPAVAEARASVADADYQRGFDIATGIFGDPALGALGNTLTGSGVAAMRDTLSASAQSGFDASMELHSSRHY